MPPKAKEVRPGDDLVGFYGLNTFSTLVQEEYLPELRGVKKIDTYVQMRSDGKVEALLNACKKPIVGANWQVVPGGTQKRARDAADRVKRQLGIGDGARGPGMNWSTVVGCALNALDYGFQVLTESWRLDAKEYVLNEFLDIHPRTILQGTKQWDFDARGKVRGLWQTGHRWANGVPDWREDYIPIDRCTHVVFDQKHGNPEGRALLRSPYKHWWIKDNLYRFDAIGHERGSSGFPVASYPEGSSDEVIKSAEEACAGICVSEAGYVTKPDTVLLENFDLKVKTAELMQSITHHDHLIVLVGLAQWLNLGQDKRGGSQALGESQQDFFMVSLESHGNWLADLFTDGPAWKITNYNQPSLEVELYPRIVCKVNKLSVFGFADAMRKLLGPQPALNYGPRDEAIVRERLQLPESDHPDAVAPIPVKAPPGENAGGSQPANPDAEGDEAEIDD